MLKRRFENCHEKDLGDRGDEDDRQRAYAADICKAVMFENGSDADTHEK